MRSLAAVLGRLARETAGATAVEYAIMAAGIAAVIIAAVALLGTSVRDLFASVPSF